MDTRNLGAVILNYYIIICRINSTSSQIRNPASCQNVCFLLCMMVVVVSLYCRFREENCRYWYTHT